MQDNFQPEHCNITLQDCTNRYFIIPGSSGRSEYIANNFLENIEVKPHSRGHNLYLGLIKGSQVKVGVISTGMGCPSLDIIVTELIKMGAKYLIRIGTSGSFDSQKYPLGSVVIATGAVRDEGTSSNYAPLCFPAIPNIDLVKVLEESSKNLNIPYTKGIIHTKDSLMAREYKYGCKSDDSIKLMKQLKNLGVVASEMESSHLFILGSTYNVKVASILSIIGGENTPFGLSTDDKKKSMDNCIIICLDCFKKLKYL